MKNTFTKFIIEFIITIAMLLIIVILAIFGFLIYSEFKGENALEKVENIVSTYETLFSDVEDSVKKTTPEIIETTADTDVLNQIDSTPTLNNPTQTEEKDIIDKYFYKQLDENSKIIYQALMENQERMKTGTAQIELGSTFSDLLSTEGGDKLLGEYYQSAVETYLYDNPGVFYISANKLYLNIETTTRFGKKTYNVFINNGTQPNYYADEFTSEEQVKQAIEQVEQVKNKIVAQKTGDTYEDIKMVHDYLVDNLQYETTISKDNIYNIYGALINHECVCEGYAEAFKYLLDALEIKCTLVIGEGTNTQGQKENHAWNYVQIYDKWYAVDSTWDDPVIIGNGPVGYGTKYKYFLKGESQMMLDHTPSTHFTENGRDYTYPELNWKNY